MLDEGEMDRHEDLSDFDKGQIIMARRLGQSIQNGLWGAPGQHSWVATDNGPNDKPQAGDGVMGTQGSPMHKSNEGLPI